MWTTVVRWFGAFAKTSTGTSLNAGVEPRVRPLGGEARHLCEPSRAAERLEIPVEDLIGRHARVGDEVIMFGSSSGVPYWSASRGAVSGT